MIIIVTVLVIIFVLAVGLSAGKWKHFGHATKAYIDELKQKVDELKK